MTNGSRQNYLPDIPIFQSENTIKLVLFTQQTHILPLDLHSVNGLQDPFIGVPLGELVVLLVS